MKLKKCCSCKSYTLKESCDTCKDKTSSAHYKHIKGKKDKGKSK